MKRNHYLENNQLWIVDVGASGGIDPRWSKITSFYNGILFEPDPREYSKLKNNHPNNFILLNTGLSDTKKIVDFNLCKRQEVSSVYIPNFDLLSQFPDHERFEVVDTIQLPVDTLTNQLKENNIHEIDFIKVDVQGYELPILQGGTEYLDNVIGIEVEVEFLELYKNQPLFNEVNSFLNKNNFELFDIKRYFWKKKQYKNNGASKGQLVFGDALYFKKPEQILLMQNVNKDKIMRSIFVYLSYGYVDIAHELITKAENQGFIENNIKNEFISFLSTIDKDVFIPDFKGKNRIGLFFEKLALVFQSSNFSSGTDKKLGNRP